MLYKLKPFKITITYPYNKLYWRKCMHRNFLMKLLTFTLLNWVAPFLRGHATRVWKYVNHTITRNDVALP